MALRQSVMQVVHPFLRTHKLASKERTSFIIRKFQSQATMKCPPLSAFVRFRQMSSNDSRHYDNPKIRVHAVSLLHGDYNFYDEDDMEETPFSSDDEGFVSDVSTEESSTDHSIDKHAKEALEIQREEDEKRARRIENSKPIVRVQELDERGRAFGLGGRKTAKAQVWIEPGEGMITINRREFLDYFPRESHRESIISPFVATRTCGMFDVTVIVEGGGASGKAGAIRHGIARALEKYNPDYRPPMKRLGYLTRDSRRVERKKIGLKKARKAPQWVRR